MTTILFPPIDIDSINIYFSLFFALFIVKNNDAKIELFLRG